MNPHRITCVVLSLSLALLAGVTPVSGKSDEKKRDEIRKTRDETLAELYKAKPGTQDSIKRAAGYAVFSNVSFTLGFSAGGGSGVVVDDKGKETFMKMGTAGVALGLGVKDFRAVFIFYDKEKLNDFIEKGWDFSGEADAAAKSEGKGGAAGASGEATKGVEMYQFTKAGLALSASLNGTKYWKDKDLNDE